MAEEPEKTVQQLKKERTTVKSSFTRQANFLCKEAELMVEAELRDEFNKLSEHFRRLLIANDDYKNGLLAEATKEEEEASLDKQQKSDIIKTTNEAETRFKEVRDFIQDNLWSRYGQEELTGVILEAEKVLQ